MKIKHPFVRIPFNKTINDNYIVIEFINVKTLNKIQDFKLSDSDILLILALFHYLHIIDSVYRDLHTFNIIILMLIKCLY